jgi:nucleoid DNA-binding protein
MTGRPQYQVRMIAQDALTGQDLPARPSTRLVRKEELTRQIALSIRTTRKEARALLEAVLDSLVKALRAGERVELRRFGTFSVQFRDAWIGFIPHKGTKRAVPARRVVRFHPSKEVIALLKSPREGDPPAGDGSKGR